MVKQYKPNKNNVINGYKINDKISWSSSWDFNLSVYAKTGNDIINFKKSKYKNKLYGEAGNDSIYGGSGNDSIKGGSGTDLLYGYNGRDKIYGGSGKDIIYGGNNDDTIYGNGSSDKLFGGKANDKITGGSGNDYIQGDSGNDLIYGGLGNDTIYGGSGNDTIFADDENDYIDAGSGKDVINITSGINKIYGGSGNDTINVKGGSSKISAGIGNDLIKISKGKNQLYFKQGDGNDRIKSTSGITTLVFTGKQELKFSYIDTDLVISYGISDSVKIYDFKDNADRYYIKANGIKLLAEEYKNSLSRGDLGLTLTIEKGRSQTCVLLNPFNGQNYKYTLSTNRSSSSVYLEFLQNGRLYIKGNSIQITANSSQEDDLIVMGSNNTINTGDGNDTIRLGYVVDGNGYYELPSNYNIVNSGSGNDYVTFYGYDTTINTSSGDDTVYGAAANTDLSNQEIYNAENIFVADGCTENTDGAVGVFYQGEQGGDCRFLSLIQSLSFKSDFELSKYISIEGNPNKYTVTYNNYTGENNSISVTAADVANTAFSYGDLDIVVADIALNKLIAQNRDNGKTSVCTADYNTISDYFFGTEDTTYIHKSIKYNYEDRFNELWTEYNSGGINNFTIGIFAGADYSNGIVTGHAYAVRDYSEDYITLINVWDSADYLRLDTDSFFALNTGVFVYGCDYYDENIHITQRSGEANTNVYLTDEALCAVNSELICWNTSTDTCDITSFDTSADIPINSQLFAIYDKNNYV